MKMLFTLLVLLGLSSQLYAQKIYATVNGHNITIDDINYMLTSFGEKRPFSALPKEQRDLLITQAVENRLLVENAKKEQIQNHPIYVQALKDFERKMVVEVWMKKKFDELKVSQKQLQDYYAMNKDEFQKDEQVKARHIVVETQQEAQAIIAQLNGEKVIYKKPLSNWQRRNLLDLQHQKVEILDGLKKGSCLSHFGKRQKA